MSSPFFAKRTGRSGRDQAVPCSRADARRRFPAGSPILVAVLLLLLAVPAAATAGGEKRTISFGVIPRFNPHVMYEYYQPLIDYLSRSTSYRFELRLTRSYQETISDLEKGNIDVAYLGGVTFALARHRFGARALVKPLNSEGRSTYRCLIVVRKDSPIRAVADLAGRTLALGPRRSTTGTLIPSYMIFGSGITPDRLKAIRNLSNHDEVAKAVLKGSVDAGAVKDVVGWKYEGLGLRVIAASEELPNAPIAAGPALPPDAEAALVKALLALDGKGALGRATLESFGPELRNGFVRARGDDYDFLYEKIRSIPQGCGIRCHASNPILTD